MEIQPTKERKLRSPLRRPHRADERLGKYRRKPYPQPPSTFANLTSPYSHHPRQSCHSRHIPQTRAAINMASKYPHLRSITTTDHALAESKNSSQHNQARKAHRNGCVSPIFILEISRRFEELMPALESCATTTNSFSGGDEN